VDEGRGKRLENGDRLKTVTVFVAAACHLCERAREDLEPLREELDFELEEIDIGGVPELERAYREWIPVIEVDGERVCVYRVDGAGLRRALMSER
jgi:glutaredoxin